jgi:23S rRNA pseudouridine2605 synthase
MNDKPDRPRGKPGSKPAGRNFSGKDRPGGKPGFGGKPSKPGFKKSFDKPAAGAGSDRKREDAGRKPFGERKPFGDRKSFGDRKPFVRPAEMPETPSGERIAKRLARAGISSRRDAEELIAAGRVKVNGKVLASPAFNVMAEDVIELDGTLIPPIERTRLFLFHKPAGVVTTNRDPEGRRTVFDVLPAELPRLMTVGRLDINTEGLLLLTNDGGLSRVLELPATGWLRRYRVRVHGKVDEKQLADLKDGVAVDGVFYGAIEASLDREQGANAWLTIGLREGKNREVKNILGALGLDVTRLIRVSYGPFQLGELAEGSVLEIKGRMLREQLGERLIEESGANFEAEIARPFSNKPVRRVEAPEPDVRPERPRRDASPQAPIGEGGLIKARKRREGRRDDALGKLSTRPERGGPGERRGKPSFDAKGDRGPRKAGEREQRPLDPPGTRKANVWMAPGARPIGKGRAAADAAKAQAARKEWKPAGKPFGKSSGKPGGQAMDGQPRGGQAKGGQGKGDRGRPQGVQPGEDRPRGPRKGGGGADRRR